MQIGIGISPTIPGQNTFGKGATLALDFTRNSFSSATQTVSDPSLLTGWTFTRASTKTALNSSGAVVSFATGVPAITDLGLLIEEARTNLLLWSTDYTNAVWPKINSGTGSVPVVTPAAGTAPDGTLTAQRVQLNAGAGGTLSDYSGLEQIVTGSALARTTSIWIKSFTGTAYTVALRDAATGGATTLMAVTAAWQRLNITSTTTNPDIQIILRGTVGTSASADILLWNSQNEAGSFATSDILTTSAAVTRAADVAKITGLSAPSQGTLLVYGLIQVASGQVGLAALNDGTANNRADLRYNNGGILSFGSAGGVSQWSALAPSGSAALGTPFHAALSFTAGAQIVTLNGAGTATATGASIGAGMTQLQIGAVDNGIAQTNGYIQRLILNPTPNTGLAQ